jgi:hypothetical protein
MKERREKKGRNIIKQPLGPVSLKNARINIIKENTINSRSLVLFLQKQA